MKTAEDILNEKQGDIVWITSKFFNVLMNPF